MSADRPPRSYLYAPADRPELVEKALAGAADVVVADLEDAVAADRKAAARANVVALLRERPEARLHVRVNVAGSPAGRADLAAIAAVGAGVVRVPKVAGAEEVRVVAGLLGGAARIGCLLESAAGIEQAYAIATADPAVAAIGLGEADLAADLGVARDQLDAGLAFARSRCVVAARAAGLPRPVQSVYPDVRDAATLERTTRTGKALGFFGRSAIHPAQVAVINRVFLPSEAELADARTIVAALAGGVANAVLPDGRYVDAAVADGARSVLAWERQAGGEA